MVQCIVSIQSLGWVNCEQLVQQVQCILVTDVRFQTVFDFALLALGYLQPGVGLQMFHTRENLWRDGAAKLANERELMLLCCALHNRATGPHLCHYTPSPPHINWWAIVPLSQQQFWRSVPQCDHTVCVAVGLTLAEAERSCQSKVCQF